MNYLGKNILGGQILKTSSNTCIQVLALETRVNGCHCLTLRKADTKYFTYIRLPAVFIKFTLFACEFVFLSSQWQVTEKREKMKVQWG